ncbi:C40 family peptidase [Phenylobacterium sp.]|jgi:cell wall-associated NlpC family hydrolase|uniref:C40 family peptidase n=1 Tax=Phenylobacterium sp. TaxID=1871053 RepID=UPI002F3FE7BF
MSGDPRITPLKDGLASRALEGLARARRYMDPERLAVAVPAAAIRSRPDPAAEQVDQALYGEAFDVLDRRGGIAWGQARRDGYVGYVALSDLGGRAATPTHRVAAIRTYAFARPDIKSPATGPYSLNALVAGQAREGRFVQGADGGWFVAGHLAPVGTFETDYVTVAERHLGAAYLWGGRESHGLDCSGLVLQALLACGRAGPRDTDQQMRMGRAADPSALRRGDLVFWRGHVAIMLDAERIVHANAHHMAVAAEPLAEAVARIAGAGSGEPTAYRRIGS